MLYAIIYFCIGSVLTGMRRACDSNEGPLLLDDFGLVVFWPISVCVSIGVVFYKYMAKKAEEEKAAKNMGHCNCGHGCHEVDHK